MESKKLTQVAELLKPRRKVIAPFPAMESYGMKVGDIITDPINKGECCRYQNGDAAFTFDWELYPHLFQPIPWYAERDKKDMPQFIKWTSPGSKKEIHYFKVEQWMTNTAGVYTAHVYDPSAYLFIKDIEPATETEYLEYINKAK